jgi:hypothetical protein
MLSIPFWFDACEMIFPWFVPALALVALWIARVSEAPAFQRIAENAFYGCLILVACATLHTIIERDNCWILHMSSMAAMIVGAIYPMTTHVSDSA